MDRLANRRPAGRGGYVIMLPSDPEDVTDPPHVRLRRNERRYPSPPITTLHLTRRRADTMPDTSGFTICSGVVRMKNPVTPSICEAHISNSRLANTALVIPSVVTSSG